MRIGIKKLFWENLWVRKCFPKFWGVFKNVYSTKDGGGSKIFCEVKFWIDKESSQSLRDGRFLPSQKNALDRQKITFLFIFSTFVAVAVLCWYYISKLYDTTFKFIVQALKYKKQLPCDEFLLKRKLHSWIRWYMED